MAILKAIIVSLALGLVGSNVLGAAVKEGQATTTSSAMGDVYNETCNNGYCQWRCNDESDWCWIASVDDAVMTSNPDPHWVECKTPADCTRQVNYKLGRAGRKAMCKSSWRGHYWSLGDLKCVAKQWQAIHEQFVKQEKEREEAVRKSVEARQARLNTVNARLPPGGLDAVKEQVLKEVYPGLKKPEPQPEESPVEDSELDVFTDTQEDEDWYDYLHKVKGVDEAVESAALVLSEEDLKLPPEDLKSKLMELAKGEMREYE